MIVYTVHEPPAPAADRLDRGERLQFVKDGFSWSAALFAPLWMIANRLWLALLFYLLAIGALGYGAAALDTVTDAAALGAAKNAAGLAGLALHLIIGFEASSLKRWKLRRKGWRTLGSVLGRSAAECERRFFDAWLPHEPAVAADKLAPRAGTLGQLALSQADAGAPRRRGWRRLFARGG